MDDLLKSADIGDLLVQTSGLASVMCSVSSVCAKRVFDVSLLHLNQSVNGIQASLTSVVGACNANLARADKDRFERYCWDACSSL